MAALGGAEGVGDNLRRRGKDGEVSFSSSRGRLTGDYFSLHIGSETVGSHTNTHKQTLCFSVLNAAGKSHTTWKDSAVSLQVIFLP